MRDSRQRKEDLDFLRQTLELARSTKSDGNLPFASVLVIDGEVVADAVNTCFTDNDITAHPEIKLATWAARNLDTEQIERATLYTSTENCPMCSTAFVIAGLRRLVFALSAKQLRLVPGVRTINIPLIPAQEIMAAAPYPVEVEGPLLPDEGSAVHLS